MVSPGKHWQKLQIGISPRWVYCSYCFSNDDRCSYCFSNDDRINKVEPYGAVIKPYGLHDCP